MVCAAQHFTSKLHARYACALAHSHTFPPCTLIFCFSGPACARVEVLTAQLLFHKPDNPKRFVVKYLEEVKVTGTRPLLTEEDLKTMFGMFDITKRGVMTEEQVRHKS